MTLEGQKVNREKFGNLDMAKQQSAAQSYQASQLPHTRADRTADDSGKTAGGGLCIYINKAWCTDSVINGRHCSANLKFIMVKCIPFYLPQEFKSTFITGGYTLPSPMLMQRLQRMNSTNNRPLTRKLHL